MADHVSMDIDHVVLRNGTPAEVARYLQQLRSSTPDPAAITSHLHNAVVQGSIPHTVFMIWTPLSNDAATIVAGLRQSESLLERRIAIRAFIKALRSPESMTQVWDACGGASGLAAIMSNLSVEEIKSLCNGLAKTASLPRGRTERHVRLTELVSILGADTPSPENNPDTRPLLPYYKRILPACTIDRVAEHEETAPAWTSRQRSILLRTHPTFYQTKFMESMFSAKGPKRTTIDVGVWTQLINDNFGFGKQLLLKFLSEDQLVVQPYEFMENIAKPLARRLRRRRSTAEQQLPFETLEVLVQVIRKYPSLTEVLDASLDGTIFYVIKFWEHTRTTRPQVEQHLAELIKLAPEAKYKSADSIVPLLRAVNPAVSYQLFRLIIQNSKYYGFDVHDTSDGNDASFKKLNGPWPANLFTTMFGYDDKDIPLRLFRRLMEIFPSASFLKPSTENSISILRESTSITGDPDVLEAMLLRASSGRADSESDLALKFEGVLHERQKKASSARDWQGRASWAQSALNMSIATGSLDVYSKTLLWAQRFNKDPNTVKQIYSYAVLKTTEGIELLSGISTAAYANNSDFNAAETIQSANKILFQLLETASTALREPSFQRYDWTEVLSLPASVLENRFRLVNDFQDARKLSDAEVFDQVWRPTLEFLLEAENYLLRPGMQRLYPRHLLGILHGMPCFKGLEARPHVDKFWDSFAKGRDELWQTYRSQHFPAVLALSETWPRGLPLQSLLPGDPLDLKNIDNIPYVRSRIENVVFGEPEILLQEPPKDKESRAGIGPFVDNYNYAIKAYVNITDDPAKNEELVHKAWRHAVDRLNGTRMTTTESLRFWAEVFHRNGIKLPHDLRSKLPKRPEPSVPDFDNPEMPTEWNPLAEHGRLEFVESRELPGTILDQMLMEHSTWAANPEFDQEALWEDSVKIQAEDRLSFWDLTRFSWPLSGKTKDGTVVSLLLYLNTTKGANNSILREPFPSGTDVRYPALYLEQEFLETVDTDYFGYQNSRRISSVIRSGPPSLLARVARSILQRVEDTENSESNEQPPIDLAMKLIGLLVGSDRPSLAFPLIRDVILDRPNDSSWHRNLLSKRLFNILPPAESKNLLDMISDGLQKRLDDQLARNKEAKEENGELPARSPPAVKVTTVKMLAKLLSDAPFLDIESSIDILTGLLAKSQHIDIRVAIIESLFDTLEAETASPEVKGRILVLLKKLALPIAASFNERRPITDADWKDAEGGGELPEVAERRDLSAAPVRTLFLHLNKRLRNDPETKATLARITVRLLKQSAENNLRWTELFLRKYGFSLPPGEVLLTAPVEPKILRVFTQCPEYFSKDMFEMLRGVVLTNLRPSPGIAAITNKIKENPELSNSNARSHWLNLYGGGRFAIELYGAEDCFAVMHKTTLSQEVADTSNRITSSMLQEFALEVAGELIRSGHPSYVVSLFDSMTSAMLEEKSLESLQRWKTTTKPVLQKIIGRVEGLRTSAWQRNPKRKPQVLPDTFRLKVAMLAVPPGLNLEEEVVREVSDLINDLAGSREPYHENWAHLKRHIVHMHADWKPRLAHLALRFGSLENVNVENPTLADYLRIDMAKTLVEQARDPKDKNIAVDLKATLRSWAECPIESFRDSARDAVQTMRSHRYSGWFTDGGDQAWEDKQWFTDGDGLEWADKGPDDSDAEGGI